MLPRLQNALRFLALLFCVALLAVPLFAQQPKVLAPHVPVAPRLEERQPWSQPMVRQLATGGLWMTDANWKASLYLKNGVKTDPITVTPVLYLSNGQRYPLSPVTLEPSGTAIVDIGQGLASHGIAPYATLYGYAEIEYQWPWAGVSASVRNVDTVNSLIYLFGLQSPPNSHAVHVDSMPVMLPNSFEGLWWKQEKNVSGFVALANVTGQAISATLRLTDSADDGLASYKVTVSPHGTKMIALNELKTTPSEQGGIYLTHDGPEHGLAVNAGLQDQVVGYSAHLWVLPSPQPSSATPSQPPARISFSQLGLMTGAADPMMNFLSGTVFTPYSLVRNTSDKAALVTPELWWMAGGAPQSSTLPQLTIAPHHTVNLNASALLVAAGLKNFNGSVNLILDTQAQPGGLLMSSGSVDERNTYVFEVMAHAIAEGASRQVCYWSTGNGDDTMVTLWNPADEPQEFAFTLFSSGGQYVYPIQLGARETRAFNVSEILHSSIPDVAGNVIPAGATEGSAEIAGSQGEQQHILVSVDVGVYNVRKAICGSPCQVCNGVTSADITPGPFGVAIGESTQETFYENWNTGGQYNNNGNSTWSTSSTSIAGVDNGLVTGIAFGTFTLSAEDHSSEPVYVQQFCAPNQQCPTTTWGGSASGTVDDNTPVLTGIGPSDWNAGATTDNVNFTGQYFGTNAPTLTFSPSSGISYALVSYNDTQIVANVTVASGTPNEQVTVTVTNNGYGGSSFNGGSVGQPATSTPVNATVHAPINSSEVTVIGWVDGTAPDLNPLPGGANQNLVTHLNGAVNTCAADLFAWSVAGARADLLSTTDEDYANRWLIKYSANSAPPATITPSNQRSGGNYRLYNDFGGSRAGNGVDIGITPDPCGANVPASILNWIATGQKSTYMGESDTSPSGKIYQLSEGRVGTMGQKGYETINGKAPGSMPWIWSVIEFDSTGNPTYSDTGMFPTYSVYVNGTLVNTYHQSAVESFFAKDQTYQRTPSQIP
jgi:hypothetical protein